MLPKAELYGTCRCSPVRALRIRQPGGASVPKAKSLRPAAGQCLLVTSFITTPSASTAMAAAAANPRRRISPRLGAAPGSAPRGSSLKLAPSVLVMPVSTTPFCASIPAVTRCGELTVNPCRRSARWRRAAVIPRPGRTYAAPHRCSREVSVGRQGWPLAVGLGVLVLLLERLWGHSCTALSLGEQWGSARGGSHLQCLCVFCMSRNGTVKDVPSAPKLVAGGNLGAVSVAGHLEAHTGRKRNVKEHPWSHTESSGFCHPIPPCGAAHSYLLGCLPPVHAADVDEEAGAEHGDADEHAEPQPCRGHAGVSWADPTEKGQRAKNGDVTGVMGRGPPSRAAAVAFPGVI